MDNKEYKLSKKEKKIQINLKTPTVFATLKANREKPIENIAGKVYKSRAPIEVLFR